MAPSAVSPPPTPAAGDSVTLKSCLAKRRLDPSSDGNSPSTPLKRPKILAFDTVLDVAPPSPSEAKDVDVALLRETLTFAIKHHDGAGKEKYEEIKAHFDEPLDSDEALASPDLRSYLVALISNAPLLKRPYSDLVNAVLQHHWLARDDAFVSTFTRFLGHLVAAQGGYLHSVLKMLVENFAHLSTSAGRYPSSSTPSRSKLHLRIHSALKYLLQLIPSASGSLSSILSQSFPFIADSKRAHVDYVRNLLRITEYAPELKSVVLDLTVERLLKIDVQVQDDIEELQEDAAEIIVQTQALKNQSRPGRPDGDGFDSDDGDSDASDDEDLTKEEINLKSLSSSVAKMDNILDLLFAFHTPVISGPKHYDASSAFGQLLSQFRNSILPTYRSRHTQFLLLHFAQASPEFVSMFTETCLKILADRSRSTALRVSATAYLASFVARASRVESDMVIYIFNTLAQHCTRLREGHEPACRGPETHKYGTYYAIAQALMYIFCFRWRDLVSPSSQASDADSDGEDDIDVEDAIDTALYGGGQPLVFLPLAKDAFVRNFHSPLNPLKVCAPEVVEEFAKIAHHLNFMYIYPLLETNKRVRLAPRATASAADGGRDTSLTVLRDERARQLEAYFPFDPYNLPISKRWLVGDYREWEGVPGLREEPRMSFAGSEASASAARELLSDEDLADADDNVVVDDEMSDGEDGRTATPGDDDSEDGEDPDDDHDVDDAESTVGAV